MVAFGEYIRILSPDHLVYITGLVIIAGLMVQNRHRIKLHRSRLTLFLILISLIQQFLLYSAYFYLLDFDLAESLPLHISRINTILGLAYLVTRNDKLFGVMAYLGLYAWTSFLYPSRVYGITHPLGISFFINHAVTLLLPFYGMMAYDARLGRNDHRRAFSWFLVYLAAVLIINPLVDGNYFYLKHKPFFGSLSNEVYLVLVLLVTYLLLYLGSLLYFRVQSALSKPTSRT